MAKNKYCNIPTGNVMIPNGIMLYKNRGKPDETPIAVFFGINAETNAQKVCDLLNETSRSQGVYPK